MRYWTRSSRVGGPGEDAFDAGGVRSDNANGGEGDAELDEIIFHELEPLIGDLAGVGVDVDLLGIWEVVAEGTESFVLGIEVDWQEGDLAGLIPVGDSEGDTGFADAAFTAGREDYAFVGVVAIGMIVEHKISPFWV